MAGPRSESVGRSAVRRRLSYRLRGRRRRPWSAPPVRDTLRPAAMSTIPDVTVEELIARYDTLLFDAYGVLVHRAGALPGAASVIDRLNRSGKPDQRCLEAPGDGGRALPRFRTRSRRRADRDVGKFAGPVLRGAPPGRFAMLRARAFRQRTLRRTGR